MTGDMSVYRARGPRSSYGRTQKAISPRSELCHIELADTKF